MFLVQEQCGGSPYLAPKLRWFTTQIPGEMPGMLRLDERRAETAYWGSLNPPIEYVCVCVNSASAPPTLKTEVLHFWSEKRLYDKNPPKV